MTTPAETKTQNDSDNQKMTFDESANQVFREACDKAFLKHPEIRSIVVCYDYYKNLNNVNGISKGLWLHAEGGSEKPADSIAGSLQSTLQAAAHILDEYMTLYASLTNQLTELSQAVLEKKNELEQLQ